MAAVEVWLNDWLWRALVENRRVLTISPDYFALEMGLERRLYELARKHCGRQREWRIGLVRLVEKCGSARGLKQFRAEIAKIIERDRLPEYVMAIETGTSAEEGLAGRLVRFAPRPGFSTAARPEGGVAFPSSPCIVAGPFSHVGASAADDRGRPARTSRLRRRRPGVALGAAGPTREEMVYAIPIAPSSPSVGPIPAIIR